MTGHVDQQEDMCTGEIYFDRGVPNGWRPPCRDASAWSGADDRKLKEFYDKHVNIGKKDFHDNQEKVSRLLKHLYKEIKDIEEVHKFLRFKPFLKQGGSRERLKIGEANEFDALLPFTFIGADAGIKESPSNELPAGMAEIEITRLNRRMTDPKGVFEERDGKRYVNSRVLHDQLIKGRIDAAIQKLNTNPAFAGYNVRRHASAPAIQLHANINGKNVGIDVVPGFEIRTPKSTLRKFLVARWMPDSQNDHRNVPIPHPTTAWRVSHSQFEMRILDRWISSNPTAQRLVRGARILKAVREQDVHRNPSSQLTNVLSSYHIKNILLHGILHLRKVEDVNLPSVTSALDHLRYMMDTSLQHRNLPQFFSNNPSLEPYFPMYNFHTDYPAVNLFEEHSKEETLHIRADLSKALDHFGLTPLMERAPTIHEDQLKPFLDKL